MTEPTSQGLSATDPPLSASIGEILDAKQHAAEATDEVYGMRGGTNETAGVDGDQLVSVVRAHPLQSLGVAIALGLVAGMLFRRR